jgi:D-alanyl-D-alanine carboxypeptidase
MARLSTIAALITLLPAFGCARGDGAPASSATPSEAVSPVSNEAAPRPSPSQTPATARWVKERPAWLGKRILPQRPDGFGVVRPTPPILRNRRFATIDLLPAPDSARFHAAVGPVPRRVAERSSWRPECPVSLDELAYLTMTFWGFDHHAHTGEMLVNSSVAQQVVGVFKTVYSARFPIEEMRIITSREVRKLDENRTGDTNVTSSFECREVTLGTTWSQHAYGLAIDINPFHNPYVRGDLVAPELASAYVDRTWKRPGMIFEGDAVTRAFDAIGWGWGGRWTSLKDWMHFSQNGR